MCVYANHTEIRIRKLNPNSKMSINILDGVSGTREISEIAPIDRASPKMRSESDLIRGQGRFVCSSKEGSQPVTMLSRKGNPFSIVVVAHQEMHTRIVS